MSKARLETISDAVIAILITIMVLQLHTPDDSSWGALHKDIPVLLAYVLSFVNLGIYWNNHHHMLAAVNRVDGAALWANLHLLFWLSLIPFTTAWMSAHHLTSATTAAYGIVLLAAGVAYFVLQAALLRVEGRQSLLATAIGRDFKGKASPLLYCLGIGLSFVSGWLAIAVYIGVALMWFVPDPRLERRLATERQGSGEQPQ
jgi:TMEM175 potassium channel family protein